MKYVKGQAVREFIRFGLVGIVSTGIHYLIYYLLQQVIPADVAYTIAYAISLVVNFIFTARFIFKTQATVRKGTGFGLAHLCNYLFANGIIIYRVGYRYKSHVSTDTCLLYFSAVKLPDGSSRI